MKKISLAKEIRWAFLLLCGACCCMFASCEDNREEYLGDYQTRFYFRNSGVQPITLFKVGKKATYQIPVCKTGYNQDGTGKVTVSVMDQEQLEIYNLTNLTTYKQLPSALFKFLTEREFYFESDDSYKIVKVELNTDAISDLQESEPDSEYVLALQVHSDGENTLSPDVNMLFIAPSVDIVRCSLSTSGIDTKFFYPSNLSPQEFSNSLRVNFDNSEYGFAFSYGLDVRNEEWLNAYNEANGTSYALLPADMYTLPNPMSVAFAEGKSTSEEFKITVDPAKMELLKDYLLPIYVVGCQETEYSMFLVDEKKADYLLNVRLDPDKVELTADMASSPYTNTGDGQGIKALFDGVATKDSWWHSKYSEGDPIGDPDYGYYIDIALAEPLSAVVFKYATRSNPNAVPAKIRIGVSNDGETWTEIGYVDSGLPTGALEWATLPAFSHTKAFTHIRFGVVGSAGGAGGDLTVKTSKCVALSELELYGANLIDAN